MKHFSEPEKCFKNGFGATGPGPERALQALLQQFSESEKCFNKRFGVSSGPGPELAPKPLSRHFSGTEKCFENGFVASSGLGPELAQQWPRTPPKNTFRRLENVSRTVLGPVLGLGQS